MTWNRQQSDDDARTQSRDDEAGGTVVQPDTAAVLDAATHAVPEQMQYERRTGGGRLFEVFITPVASSKAARASAVTVLV